uniref:Ovule protein n=1 Tax=Angiostrongylus cantonensis TaxID=6313 RepID=A0A0K0DQT6_ANGCA
MEQKTSQSDQLSFTKHSRGASSESSVFGNSALVAAPNPFSNVRNYDLVNKVFSFVDHMAEDQQKQPCRSSTESPDQNEPIAGNMFSNNQFEAQHSVAYSIINEECRSSILPNCSSISHTTPLEVDSSSAGAPGNALSDMFALFRDHNNEENEEKTAVFLPL